MDTDYSQSIVAGASSILLKPLFNGAFGYSYFEKLIEYDNLIAGLGLGVSDAVAQNVVNSVSGVSSMVRGSSNGVDNAMQAATTGLTYEVGSYLYDIIVEGSQRAFFKKSTLKSIIKLGLVDSFAQIATPNIPMLPLAPAQNKTKIQSLSNGGETPAINKPKTKKTKVVSQPAPPRKKNSSKIVS